MGRQVLEALAEAPVLALAAGDVRGPGVVAVVGGDDVVVNGGGGGVLVVAVPRARLEALPVVHVLVVHRPRRGGEERRDNNQDNAERFEARHRWSLAVVVLGELMSLTAARSSMDWMHGASCGPYIYAAALLPLRARRAMRAHTESVRPRHPAQLAA